MVKHYGVYSNTAGTETRPLRFPDNMV